MAKARRPRLYVKPLERFPRESFGALAARFVSGDFGGVSVVHESLPPRSRLPDLYHRRTDELVIMLKGRMTATLNGRRRTLRAGDVAYLPAGTRHRFETGAAAAEALSIFSPAMTFANLDVVKVAP